MSIENVKYYKNLDHNYLIIKDNIKEVQNYQHKMITKNQMKYFLTCKIRYVNQECHFYYEISSKQNITYLFDRKPMGYEQIHCLFEYMKEALAELDNYLLNSKCLVLRPEYIFGNPETGEYFFLYYPHYAEEEEKEYMALAEFLVEKVDHAQEEAAAIVYKIYEMAQDNAFILSKILDLFTKTVLEAEEEAEEILVIDKEQDAAVLGNLDISENQEEREEERGAKHLAAAGILSFMCLIAAAGVFGIRYFYVLSMEEAILSLIGSIVLILVSASLLLYLIFNFYGRKRQWKEDKKNIDRQRWAGDLPMADSYYETISNQEVSPRMNLKKIVQENKSINMDEIEYGNTVFLEPAMCRTEHKLYGTNKGNKYHINLEKLPCTIGKMAGSVDVVIKDSTISRIHARFTRQEEGICVTDMNSTNGTFKNGLRLEPNETVLIEHGDELRFGRMTFCYR